MGLLDSSNKDVLSQAVIDVGKKSYGMIYLEEDWEEIKDIYVDNEETGGLITDATMSQNDIRTHLDEMSEAPDSPIQKIRDNGNVYFMDLIGMGRNEEEGLDTITPKIVEVFDNKAIIDKKSLADEFGVSSDDDDFFIENLIKRNYLKKIKTGVHSYFVIGDYLKGEYDTTTISQQLKQKGAQGTISQTQLSRVVSVDAKEDVINYLETVEELILDLGGEFLILDDESIGAFTKKRAKEIKGSIENSLDDKGNILPVEEFEGYVVESLESKKDSEYPDALAKAENLNMREELLEQTIDHLEETLQLRKENGLYMTPAFEETVREKAIEAVEAAGNDNPTSDVDWIELAMKKIDKEDITSSPIVIEHFDKEAKALITDLVDDKFGGSQQ